MIMKYTVKIEMEEGKPTHLSVMTSDARVRLGDMSQAELWMLSYMCDTAQKAVTQMLNTKRDGKT